MTDTTTVTGPTNALEAKLHKLRKVMPNGLAEELEAMDEDGLRKRIVQCEVNMHEVEAQKEADTELETLRDRVKDIAAPYADAKKAQSAIAQYATIQLMKMGKA